VNHFFANVCEQRDALQQQLQQRGVQTLIHYPVPVYQQATCADLKRDPKGLLNSDCHAVSGLSLPCYPQLTDSEI
jgi:dTDP-4-amino-4,6-dideoxygalactose transaminase